MSITCSARSFGIGEQLALEGLVLLGRLRRGGACRRGAARSSRRPRGAPSSPGSRRRSACACARPGAGGRSRKYMYGLGLSDAHRAVDVERIAPGARHAERPREDDLERVAGRDVLLRAADAPLRTRRRRGRPRRPRAGALRSGSASGASGASPRDARGRARRRRRRRRRWSPCATAPSKTTMVAPPKKRASGAVMPSAPARDLLDRVNEIPRQVPDPRPSEARGGPLRRVDGLSARLEDARARPRADRRPCEVGQRSALRTDPLPVGAERHLLLRAVARGSSSAPSARRRRRSRAGTTRSRPRLAGARRTRGRG